MHALCKTYTTYHSVRGGGVAGGSKGQKALSQRPEKAFFYLFQYSSLVISLCFAHPQTPAPPYKREVRGVLLHTQKLHKSIWQDACGVGSRDGLELRSSYLSVSPSFNHQVAISRGAKGVLVGKHGTLLRTLTQMDPWTVCRLLLMDDICSGGGGGELQRQTVQEFLSYLF